MEKDHLTITIESMDKQFQLIIEGHSPLANQIADFKQEAKENFDFVNFKIETFAADLNVTDERLSKKIDAIAVDLKAHRVDTEARGNEGIHVVREGRE